MTRLPLAAGTPEAERIRLEALACDLTNHCVTCGDEAVEVVVVELLEHDLARVDTGAGIEEVSVALVSAGIGDTILVHAKEALAVVGR